MKKIFFLGFLCTIIVIFCISYVSSRTTCNTPSPTWIDRNGNGLQEPDEFIIPLGECSYKIQSEIGFPRIITVSQSPMASSTPVISVNVDDSIGTEVLNVMLNGIWGTLGGFFLYFIARKRARGKLPPKE